MSVRIGLLGLGTVGAQVARILTQDGERLEKAVGEKLELVGIGVRSLDAKRDWQPEASLLTTDSMALAGSCDLVIELIGGINPARELITTALNSGASVVTGNKALLATHGGQLLELAQAKGVDLLFEAAVAGAIPVVRTVKEGLAGDKIISISGILNGTTNYILDEMTTKGLDYDTALAAAQQLGYAEADPTADVEGLDAAAKAAILATLAFGQEVTLADVSVTGISKITKADIDQAAARGGVLRLLGTVQAPDGQAPDGQPSAVVEPVFVANDHPLAAIHGPGNAVVIECENAGRLTLTGPGAGGAPTASAVMGDVVAAARALVARR